MSRLVNTVQVVSLDRVRGASVSKLALGDASHEDESSALLSEVREESIGHPDLVVDLVTVLLLDRREIRTMRGASRLAPYRRNP